MIDFLSYLLFFSFLFLIYSIFKHVQRAGRLREIYYKVNRKVFLNLLQGKEWPNESQEIGRLYEIQEKEIRLKRKELFTGFFIFFVSVLLAYTLYYFYPFEPAIPNIITVIASIFAIILSFYLLYKLKH